MLFHVSWEYTDQSEAGLKKRQKLFSRWQPGPAQFQAFCSFADGAGGFATIEAASAADVAKTIAPWTPFLKFTVRLALPIMESAEIDNAAIAWRDGQ